MKKIYFLLAAMAMTAGAQAQTLQGSIQVGDYDSPSDLYNGSYWDVAPLNFYIAHTGAQLIYTPTELAGLEGKEGIEITKLAFKFYNEMCYDDMQRYLKVYLQESDATEFAVVDGKKQFFDFTEYAPDFEDDSTWEMLDLLYEDTELVVDLSTQPFTLTAGKSLIVTIIADADDNSNCTSGVDECNFYTSGISGQGMTYANNTTGFEAYKLGDNFPDATASLGCGTNVELPVTLIEYNYTETPAVVKSAVTFDANPENGSVAVFVGELPIASGDEVEEGATVSIIAEGATGYEVESITVTSEDTPAPAPLRAPVDVAADNSFVMPASPVSISVTFKLSTPTGVTEVRTATEADAAYYDLTGRVVDAANLAAGIYIHAGKKVVVK